jgi:hypothetical protein
MASYKEANDRMNQTGAGLEGLDLTNFQEYIVNQVCKYYFELDSVMRDRPNVQPWFTNEHTLVEINDESDDDNSIESVGSMLDSSNDTTTDTDVTENDDRDGRRGNLTHRANMDTLTNTSIPFVTTPSSGNDSSDATTGSNQIRIRNDTVRKRTNSRNEGQSCSRTLSPMEAKKTQKAMVKTKKKSIAVKKRKVLSNKVTGMDQEDRDLIIETRDVKMSFEREKHMDMKEIEKEKLMIDKERLSMEKETMIMKKDKIIAQKEQLNAQASVEKTRIVIMRMEMFKNRLTLKKEFPDVTDEYLAEQFPYPE